MGMGKLIAFEGADCAGKSSVLEKLKMTLPVIYNEEDFIYTREPGSKFGRDNESEKIRQKVLSTPNLTVEEQAILFAKSRYLHTLDIVKALKEGKNVITDRYLISSIVYQGTAMPFEEVLKINSDTLKLLKDNNIDINSIVFKISKETYNERMSKRKTQDALENVNTEIIANRINIYNNIEAFINAGIFDKYPVLANNIYSIDANGTKYSQVFINTLNIINRILKEEK